MLPLSRSWPLCLLVTVLVHGTAATTATAQRTYPQDKMKASFAEMQAEPWFTGGGWTTDFDAAKARAAETGKPVFAYFTRTYAP